MTVSPLGSRLNVETLEEALQILRTSSPYVPSLPEEPPHEWTARAKREVSRHAEGQREAAVLLCNIFPSLTATERTETAERLLSGIHLPSDDVPPSEWTGQKFFSLQTALHGLDIPEEIVSLLYRRTVPSVARHLRVGNVSEYPTMVYKEVLAYHNLPVELLSDAFQREQESLEGSESFMNPSLYYHLDIITVILSHVKCPADIIEWGAGSNVKEHVEAVAGNVGADNGHRVYAQLRLMSWTEE